MHSGGDNYGYDKEKNITSGSLHLGHMSVISNRQ